MRKFSRPVRYIEMMLLRLHIEVGGFAEIELRVYRIEMSISYDSSRKDQDCQGDCEGLDERPGSRQSIEAGRRLDFMI